jgi:septal ring-binding cell division protein DamX
MANDANTKKRTLDAAGRRKKGVNEPEEARLLEAEPTEMQELFAEWIEQQTGYKVDIRSTILASLLRAKFQKSPENQQRLADNKARREHEEIDREQRKKERAERREAKIAAVAEREANREAKSKEKAEKPKPTEKKAAAPKAKTAAKAPAKKTAAPAKKTAAKPAPRRRPAKNEDF